MAADAVPASEQDERLRRALDIVAAAIGIAVFSPILLISAMAIKIAWRRLVLTQETVFDKCNARPVQALRFGVGPGSRATNLSQALRHSGIDELPQLVNVLRGEMSIFGRRNVYRWPTLPF